MLKSMNTVLLSQPQPSDTQFPMTPEIISSINGKKAAGISSDQVRELKRMLNGYTGGILLEVQHGHVVAMHPIKMTTYTR